MVVINRWIGRLGNNLFQYAAARLVAKSNHLHLSTEWIHDNILKVMPWHNYNRRFDRPIVNINFCGDPVDNNNDRVCLSGNHNNHKIIMDGYFQRSDYFNKHRDEIRIWFEPCIFKQNHEDWVINYRVSDYWHPKVRSVINPDWHISILENNDLFTLSGATNIYVVTEDPKDPCVEYLVKKTNATIISEGERHDFNFIRSFDNIINANGSFSWWASFIGTPKKNYFFKPWMRDHCLNLSQMNNSYAIDGAFAENPVMESKDWDGYWLKK